MKTQHFTCNKTLFLSIDLQVSSSDCKPLLAQICTKICSVKTALIRFYSGHQRRAFPSMISSNGTPTSLIFTCCELVCGWKESMVCLSIHFLYSLNSKLSYSHNWPQSLFRSSPQSAVSRLGAWLGVEESPELVVVATVA